MFYIEVKGKRSYYADIEKAISAANEVFKHTGIVLGIFKDEDN